MMLGRGSHARPAGDPAPDQWELVELAVMSWGTPWLYPLPATAWREAAEMTGKAVTQCVMRVNVGQSHQWIRQTAGYATG